MSRIRPTFETILNECIYAWTDPIISDDNFKKLKDVYDHNIFILDTL